MLRWELYDAGLQNLGQADAPLRREVPRPGPGELLVQVDACGICFSDIKILNLGGRHPRLQGRDLRADPVVMGHEVSVTVVAAGPGAPEAFPVGQRAIVQADIYSGGVNMAFGYRIAGGYSQYALIGREILAGDEGCYLLPIAPQLGYAEAALCEPWACVEASYRCGPRRAPRAGGDMLLYVSPSISRYFVPRLHELRFAPALPVGRLTVLHHRQLDHMTQERLARAAHENCFMSSRGWSPAQADAWDDIIAVGPPDASVVESFSEHLKPQGTLCLIGASKLPAAKLDIGRIHYQGLQVVASPGLAVMSAYAAVRSAELVPRGRAWFIGAGGPLGQMHLYRALTLPEPPREIVVTQNTGPRLDDLRQRFGLLARQRDVTLTILDPRSLSGEELDERLTAGFDDIICIVPSGAVVEHAQRHLGPGGGFNLFAGVPVGTTAMLDLNLMLRGARFWGTSGSSIADLRSVLEKVERGELTTDTVVAAVGGIQAVKVGLAAVRDARFLGKTMIYPQLEQLPLMPVEECARQFPSVGEKLTGGRYWNRSAEAELLRLAR
jgi:D-arabinose 1-dehydrogenase-like Zn-dependent alcohol dehydrogenase